MKLTRHQHINFINRNAGLKLLLNSLTIPYYLAYQTRRLVYDSNLKQPRKLPCQVISVGNLTLGGTGKTPFVEKLAQMLGTQGLKVAVLSRGYRRKSKHKLIIVSNGKQVLSNPEQAGDEPLMLAENLPGVPVIVSKNRYQAGKLACKNWSVDVILLDDGFQHWPLARDLDLVLIDASQDLAKLRLFPRGYLREPFIALSRADALILTKCNEARDDIAAKINFLRTYTTNRPIFETSYATEHLVDIKTGQKLPPGWLTGKKLLAFCGLAAPQSFFFVIQQLGGQIVAKRLFSDHHYYAQKDLEQLSSRARKEKVDAIITSQKDFVKLRHLKLPDLPILYLRITHQFQDQSESRFCQFLLNSLS